ncbi:MAG TPA: IS481 family transposase [Trebonia sp.]|nr:IS481 family transposase [Trebonia sp.]
MVEQRYQAVLEVLDGIPVTEVAERFGVSRQTVHRWVARYRAGGLAGLADRSHAPKAHPWQTSAEVEAVICDLRAAHRSWGSRRPVFELERRGRPGVSRSTVYRVLVRHHLIEPVSRRRRRDSYRRWERSTAMELWQMDVTASLFLADGRECKVITGIDDHSRFCVIAAVVMRATARAVCLAFTTAMAEYGIPGEILTDNGKQFTGRFGRPRPAEVMFERICRENGITQRLTKPRSPTTTGKIERLHQTLQLELLNVHGPFASIEDAQAALDAWRRDYNTMRPHQSLDMAFPAARFAAPAADAIGLRIPAELTRPPQPPAASEAPEPDDGAAAPPAPDPGSDDGQGRAVELDRVVPPSGNLWIAGQQVWLGPAMTGRTVRLWAGLSQVHVLLDGHRIKTLPSRLDARDLARLTAAGAQPAGPPPLPPASGDVIEVDRTVNASGNISLGDRIVSAGLPLAGQRVTLRLDGPVAHVLAGGVLVRTVACPVPAEARPRLRGARPGTARPPRLPEPLVVTRRVSVRGSVMVGGQRIQVGLVHARKTVQVSVGPDTYEVAVETGITVTAARTTNRDIRRHKASNYG